MSDVENRRHQRYQVHIEARCFIEGSKPIDIVIVDISEGGFGLNSALPFEKGSRLSVLLPEVGMFAAMIAWKSEHRCGLQLLDQDDDLPAPALDELGLLITQLGTSSSDT
jgi:PilZ domain